MEYRVQLANFYRERIEEIRDKACLAESERLQDALIKLAGYYEAVAEELDPSPVMEGAVISAERRALSFLAARRFRIPAGRSRLRRTM